MSKFIKQAGFGLVEFILVLAALALIGFIGWRVYDQNRNSAPESSDTTDNDTPIRDAEDLDEEIDELNSQDIDEQLDTSEIDSALE